MPLAGSTFGLPTAPRKSPMTAMSGLKTFAFVTDAPVAPVVAGSAAGGRSAEPAAGGGGAVRQPAALRRRRAAPRARTRRASNSFFRSSIAWRIAWASAGVCPARLRGRRRRNDHRRPAQARHNETKRHAHTSRSPRRHGQSPESEWTRRTARDLAGGHGDDHEVRGMRVANGRSSRQREGRLRRASGPGRHGRRRRAAESAGARVTPDRCRADWTCTLCSARGFFRWQTISWCSNGATTSTAA